MTQWVRVKRGEGGQEDVTIHQHLVDNPNVARPDLVVGGNQRERKS